MFIFLLFLRLSFGPDYPTITKVFSHKKSQVLVKGFDMLEMDPEIQEQRCKLEMMNRYLVHKVLERQFEGDFLVFKTGFLYWLDSMEKSLIWERFNGVTFEDPVVYPIKVRES